MMYNYPTYSGYGPQKSDPIGNALRRHSALLAIRLEHSRPSGPGVFEVFHAAYGWLPLPVTGLATDEQVAQAIDNIHLP